MKKLLVALCFTCALALAIQAEEGKKCEMTVEQKAVKEELTKKYDANNDGKLDKEERSKMSAQDKENWQKAFPHHGKKGCAKK
jgi:hypothetical protein